MAAPAESSTTTTTAAAGQDEAVVVKTTKPLPRAIQLVMTISSRSNKPSSTTTSTKTVGEHGVDSLFLWLKLVFMPSMFIAVAALATYSLLCDDDDDDELISGAGGFGFVAVLVLECVYLAVVQAAEGHLGLFAPQTPYAALEALHKVGFEEMCVLVIFTSFVVGVLNMMLDQARLLLIAWAYLLGLLGAATVALWLCLLRTYGDGSGERREKNSCGEAVIDGLAYIYSRLLYEYAVRFLADADAGMQQLDTDSSNLV